MEREGGPGPAKYQQVITTHWWMGQGRKARAREDPPTSVVNSLVVVGAGKDQGWGEQATNESYLLVVVVKREGQGWGERTTNKS